MGSFYSSCSVSNMTLSYQKTSILLLVPAYSTDYKEHLNMVVGEGCQTFFSPFGFPIHGDYDDYGYIENIVRDKNVEMLEEYFGVNIDEILQNIGDDRSIPKGIKNEDLYKNLGMTYFRTEVLQYLERGWDEMNITNPGEYTDGSRMKKIFKSLEKREEIKREISKDVKLQLMLDDLSGYGFERSTYIKSSPNMFSELPITMEFKDDMIKQYTMLNALSYLRKLLTPSNYGSQDTNWCELYKFNDFVSDLLVEDIKHDSYEEESEEENEIIRLHQSTKRDRKINNIIA